MPSGDGRCMPIGDEIVISGMSGKFPKSENVMEFMENLYNQLDMVIEVETEIQDPEIPKYQGMIDNMNKFDATFFKVTYKQVLSMNNQCRQVMSYAYGAVYDSGINPLQMKNKRLGVFIASSNVGDKPLLSNDYKNELKSTNNFIISGSCKTMYANRISYWFDSKSPSYYIDCGCVGSLALVDLACHSILSGDCEAALVGGCSMCIGSTVTMNLNNAGLLCSDGKTKCFDKEADGYVRSESFGFLFLQKAKDAKRIYAEIYHTKLGYCSSPLNNRQIIHHSNSKDIIKFLKKFYSETDVSPQEVEYVEANGIANAEDDKNELEAIGEIFGNKESAVKIGCVKSNMGNSESASGLCALTKVCLAYRNGELSGNLHYENPHDDVDAVRDGRIEVVHENTPFKRRFAAVNSFSYTGPMAHVLLKGHYKEKIYKKYTANIPYLVNVSSRNETGVHRMFEIVAAMPIDAEYIGLLHNIHKIETPGHTARGFIILGSKLEGKNEKTCVLSKSIQHYKGIKPPVCFMYSGMGSQWCKMGADLMNAPIFSAAIEKCHKVLEPKGVNIVDILTSDDQTIFEDIINCFVGITAVQIGLTDILRALEIVPDCIIGHSAGELGCAYADGGLTLEETILSAYYRGLASKQTEVIRGAMAAVGMGYHDLKKICPADIEIACHNSAGSSTISGPIDALKDFVASLKSRSIFAKEVPCGNIAYHSKYVAAVGPPLFNALKEVIKNPRKRTSKWLSTSILQSRWDEDIATLSSAEYFTNNLVSPVYFEETSKLIPNEAVVIEIAPHGLLQAIVKRSHESCEHVPLTRRGHENPTKFLLEAIGRLYQSGLNPQVHMLYPKIEYPVATDTPLLSNLVGWEHSENWPLFSEVKKIRKQTQICNYLITLYDDDKKSINRYTRNGVNVIPEALLLVLTWKTLAMARNVDHNQLSVKLDNVYFNREVSFGENKFAKIKVSINKGNHRFEITNDEIVVATGHITDDFKSEKCNLEPGKENSEDDILLTSDEIYRLLYLRGYYFNKEFKAIRSANSSISKATVEWTGEWISYIDALMQLNIMKRNHNGISTPKMIQELVIDVNEHVSDDLIKKVVHEATILDLYDTVRCGGVTIKSMLFSDRAVTHTKVSSVLLTKKNWSLVVQNDNIPGRCGDGYYTNVSASNRAEEFKVTLKTPNDFESVSLEQIATPKSLPNKTIKVYYAGVSQKDCQQSIFGNNTVSLDLGMDFSGKDVNGEQVMGLLAKGALSNVVVPDPELVWPVPRHWSLQEAATVPLPYVHALYILSKAKLINGDRVLVIGGAGALGLALISVCLSLGYIIYTTVSTLRKKEALLKLYPNLKENNIICEQNDEVLYDRIVIQTDNQLCKVVVSCASGRLREVAMKCVGFSGTFLDVNQHDVELNKSFGMSYMWHSRNYKFVDVSSIFKRKNNVEKKAIKFMLAEGIANGIVKPLPLISYNIEEVPRALNMLSSKNNIGRVLIKMDTLPKNNIIPRITCSSTATYLIVCAEDVLSLELIELLICRGARNITILWNGSATASLLYKIRYFKKSHSSVNIVFKNVINDQECTKAVKEAGGSLDGVFFVVGKNEKHSDDLSEEQILLARNKILLSTIASLDFATRSLCKNLRYFVILGNSSRDVYDEKIYFQAEKICKERQAVGLPGLTFVTEMSNELSKYFDSNNDILAETIPEVLNILERSLYINYHYIKAVLEPCSDSCSLATGRNDIDPNTTVVAFKTVNENERREKGKDISEFSFTYGNGDSMSEQSNGFRVFYSYIESDVYEITSHPLVRMSTKAYQYFQDKFEIDPSVTHLILIPGFEGHHRIFEDLCEPLKIRAATMKLDTDLNSSSIQEMALNIYKILSRKLHFNKKFYLLGYSFGVNVALELAALIEQQGERGIVYCLDSSPDALKHLMKTYAGDLSNANLQNVVAARMFHLTTGLNSEEFMKELETIDSWDKKIDIFIRRVKKLVPYSHDYMRSLLETTYNRFVLAREYQPNLKLNSELILIKSTASAEFVNLPDDYNLGKYSERPVKVYDIDGDHASAPYDIRVPTIINDSLDRKLLNEFNKTNTCETYLLYD
ncbi:PREDICTED: fatty acid synthase-like isoform X2 [Papilio xuthus]|uniref:Fatty acid synthase-like isoform X2 n=1 Tax=Papilio xuthus TaxID=66420 RepID=A0AAJ6Z0S1_PAPXU|nr:PREDICTED: fatty acid synthase-like isoform X2 [Papilio xuthus]